MNRLRLYNVEFDDKYDDVIRFATATDQSLYFASKLVKSYDEDDISVIKELSNVRVYDNYNELQTINYAFFENEIDGVTRSYYAFVTRVSWQGVGTVGIDLKIDPIQTYMFEYELAAGYVERGHVKQWIINPTNNVRKLDMTYLMTRENLDAGGEYIKGNTTLVTSLTAKDTTSQNAIENIGFIWVTAKAPLKAWDSKRTLIGSSFNYGGLYVYMCPIIQRSPRFDDVRRLVASNASGKKLASFPSSDDVREQFAQNPDVVAIFETKTIPIKFNISSSSGGFPTAVNEVLFYSPPDGIYQHVNLLYFNDSNSGEAATQYIGKKVMYQVTGVSELINRLYTQIGYDTREFEYDPKVYTFPYSYYALTSDRGNTFEIKLQYMTPTEQYATSTRYLMAVDLSLSVGYLAKLGYSIDGYLTPINKPDTQRQGVNANMGELPLYSDAYINFMSTQKASFTTGLVTQGIQAVVQAGTQIAAQNYVGAATTGLSAGLQIANAQARIEDLKNTPDSVKKAGSDVLFELLSNADGIRLTNYTVPPEVQKRLSNYFRLFGYAVNDFIEDVNAFMNTRKTYNYIKTIACRVVGKINVDAISSLEAIYNNGVRVWHYDAATWTGFDYLKDNPQVN